MVKVLVVSAHPCDDSFVAAARTRVLDALQANGHDVDLLDLYAEGFDPRLTADEWTHHRDDPSTRPQVAALAQRLRHGEVLVLVYPTWWGAQPAILKGWFERVWINGVAYRLRDDGRAPRPLLGHVRRLVVVTTHGSSKWINAVEGEAGKRAVKRALRSSLGWRCRVEWVAMYNVDRSTATQRERFLARVSRRCSRVR